LTFKLVILAHKKQWLKDKNQHATFHKDACIFSATDGIAGSDAIPTFRYAAS